MLQVKWDCNGAETNCRIAHNLGILLMNSNCFAIFFRSIHSSYVRSDIYLYCVFRRYKEKYIVWDRHLQVAQFCPQR